MTIHSLRHTYATTALNSGVAAQNVARLLGHKDGATTLKFYAHYINLEAMTQLKSLEEQRSKSAKRKDKTDDNLFGTRKSILNKAKTNCKQEINKV
jgi:hypothetical protein